MKFIDTHTHLYDKVFDQDRAMVVQRARNAGVQAVILPAVDSSSDASMFDMCGNYPDFCRPLMGLHPTSVNDNPQWKQELERVERMLASPTEGIRFYGVGEIGLDLYWSKDYADIQTEVFVCQLDMSLQYDLPVVIHTRDAWIQMHRVLGNYRGRGLRGVMHAFSGSFDDYVAVKECGDFLFGIGGVVTYKNDGGLSEVVSRMSAEDIVLETDAPYLTPVPFRGKRNESSYLSYICARVAELLDMDEDRIAEITVQNAERMFCLKDV